ncbi:MFS transporter [Saccharothrix obliqua]|uniref:MFS transporter n=1 Tax=Saccharothrix obliqua TaxID=2861747 RepID=UPI001C5DBCC0|nr:MFS transporter [Saccharothrix obliqua]MBW4715725.1 MFS transporter [Saccharothrix obliqua]
MGYRWVVLAVGALAQGTNAAVFLGLPAITPQLREHFDLTLTEVGLLLGAVNLGTVLTLVLWGVAADRRGERVVMTIGGVGAAACLALAALDGPVVAGLALVGVGLFGASVNAASGRAVMTWFPADRRGLAMGIRQTATPLGAALTAALLPAVAAGAGVPTSFLALAGCTAFTATAIATLVRDPPSTTDPGPTNPGPTNPSPAGPSTANPTTRSSATTRGKPSTNRNPLSRRLLPRRRLPRRNPLSRRPASHRSPLSQHSALSQHSPLSHRGKPSTNQPRLLTNPALLRLSTAGAFLVVPQFTAATLMVELLHNHRGLAAGTAATLLAAAQVLGGLGRLGAGAWSDRTGNRLGPLKTMAATTAAAFTLCATLTQAPPPILAAALIPTTALALSWNGLALTATAELAPPGRSGTALGMQNTANYLAATITPPLAGWLATTAGWPAALLLAALSAATARFLLSRFHPTPIHPRKP